ncbi:MAG TPA: hypothetical protein PLU17_11545 [Chitinophagaceae bacterium]|jgi:hypothetical protein|nr:hypothetical protein [Chitinophagaceae bacterium]
MNLSVSISHSVKITNSKIYFDGELYLHEESNLDAFLITAYKSLAITYPKFYKMDSMSKLGFIASELLMKNNLETEHDDYKKGLIIQNHSSSLETDKKYQASIQDIASPALFVYTLPNIVLGEMAIRHKFKGENTFFITEKFNAFELIRYTQILFDQHILCTAIIGYIEILDNEVDVFLSLIELKDNNKLLTVKNLEDLYSSQL